MHKGQSLVEVLIGVALGALLFAAGAALIAPALRTNSTVNTVQTETELTKELVDNIRAWSVGNWSNVASLPTGTAARYYLGTSQSPFTAVSGEEAITVGSAKFKRFFYIEDVNRDSSGNVTSTGTFDPSTKKITAIAEVVTYDGTLKSWQYTTPLTTAFGDTIPLFYGGYVYMPGGLGAGALTGVQYAKVNSDGTLGAWGTTGSAGFPSGGLYGSGAAIYNGKMYLVGGVTSQVTSTVLYATINSDGTLGAWTATTPLLKEAREPGAVAYNGFFYVLGARDDVGTFTSTVAYAPIQSNGALGAWAITAALPDAIWIPYPAVYNGYIYSLYGSANVTPNPNIIHIGQILSGGTIAPWSTSTPNTSLIPNYEAAGFGEGYIYGFGATTTGSAAPLQTVTYASLGGGSIGPWATTSPIIAANLQNRDAPIGFYNDFLYHIGGADASTTATSTVIYAPLRVVTSSVVQASLYVTRHANNVFNQTDWSGGSNQTGPMTGVNTKFASSTSIDYASQPGSITATTTVVAPIILNDSQSAASTSTTALGLTFVNQPAAGSLIVVTIAAAPPGIIKTPTDNFSNTYTLAVSASHMSLYYAKNVVASAGAFTVTETPSSSASLISMGIFSYGGFTSTASLDQSNTQIVTSTACTSGTVTPTAATELYFGAMTSNATTGVDIDPGSGWNALQIISSDLTGEPLWTESQIVSATTTVAATWTASTPINCEAVMATFKPS